jgi:hypothetical protein
MPPLWRSVAKFPLALPQIVNSPVRTHTTECFKSSSQTVTEPVGSECPQSLQAVKYGHETVVQGTKDRCAGEGQQQVIRLRRLSIAVTGREKLATGLGQLDGAVGTATGHGLDDRRVGVQVSVATRISTPVLAPTRPPIQWEPEYLSPEIKRPVREATLRSQENVDLCIGFPDTFME